jgi:hypothetical protein
MCIGLICYVASVFDHVNFRADDMALPFSKGDSNSELEGIIRSPFVRLHFEPSLASLVNP